MATEDRHTEQTTGGILVPGSWRNGRTKDNGHLGRVSAEDAEILLQQGREQGRKALEGEIREGLVRQLNERAAKAEAQQREKAHQTQVAALQSALDLQLKIAKQRSQRAKQEQASRQKAAAEAAKAEAAKKSAKRTRRFWPWGKK